MNANTSAIADASGPAAAVRLRRAMRDGDARAAIAYLRHLFALGLEDAAAAALRRALPAGRLARIGFALSLMRAGAGRRALAAFRRAASEHAGAGQPAGFAASAAAAGAAAAYREGRHGEALVLALDALRAQPQDADALNVAATALASAHRHAEGRTYAAQAVALEPFMPEYLVTLANCERGRDSEAALALLDRALALDPGLAAAHATRAALLQEAERFDAAEQPARRAIELDAGNVAHHARLARILLGQGRDADAEGVARAAIDTLGEQPELLLALGQALRARGSIDAAQAALERAAALAPDSTEARLTLGAFLQIARCDMAGAHACFEAARTLAPDEPNGWLNEGLLRLLEGRYSAEAWELYEWRQRDPKRSNAFRRIPLPQWDGAAAADKGLVIHGEQGIGDEIMFASMVPEAAARVARCTLACDPRLAPLFTRSFAQVRCVPWSRKDVAPGDALLEGCDMVIAAGSLGRLLRTTPGSFAGSGGYLRADPAQVRAWRTRLAAAGPAPYIGVSWRGGVYATGRTRRSLEPARLAQAFGGIAGTWVSLQRDAGAAELDAVRLPGSRRLAHLQELFADVDETAALIAALDAVVSACSWIVHLAGALDRPCFVLAPQVPDFRYGLAGRAMPWYRSVRMYRQHQPEDWSAPLQEAPRELAAFLAAQAARL